MVSFQRLPGVVMIVSNVWSRNAWNADYFLASGKRNRARRLNKKYSLSEYVEKETGQLLYDRGLKEMSKVEWVGIRVKGRARGLSHNGTLLLYSSPSHWWLCLKLVIETHPPGIVKVIWVIVHTLPWYNTPLCLSGIPYRLIALLKNFWLLSLSRVQ